MNRMAETLMAAILLWTVSLLVAIILMVIYHVFTVPSLIVAFVSTAVPASVLAMTYIVSRVNARPESVVEAAALGCLQVICTSAVLRLIFALLPEVIADPIWSGPKVLLYRSSLVILLVTLSAALFAFRRRSAGAQVD